MVSRVQLNPQEASQKILSKLGYRIHVKYNIHGERWCIQKNPNFTHLAKEHFLGHPVHHFPLCFKFPEFDYFLIQVSKRKLLQLVGMLNLYFLQILSIHPILHSAVKSNQTDNKVSAWLISFDERETGECVAWLETCQNENS